MYSVKDLLRIEVAPALGCTEPAAVALCAAAARSLVDQTESIDSVELWVDPNIYKNGLSVTIPGTRSEHGIELAAALGLVCGKPELKLEVLGPLDEDSLRTAKELMGRDILRLNIEGEKTGIYIRCAVHTGPNTAEAVIENVHDNITSLRLNGKEITDSRLLSGIARDRSELSSLEEWLKDRTLDELTALLDTLDQEDLQFLKQGLEYNLRLASHGLTFGDGLGVGKTLQRLAIEGLLHRDVILAARILTSAAADARMSGVKLPAMSSAGSGNHGLTAVLPIWGVKDHLHLENEEVVFRSIALSHIITAYIKAFTGRLSALCGCSIAAGAGATAGVTYLMGGDQEHISGAIKLLISDLAGVICDGAKKSCALKLATAAGAAVQSALFSLHGIKAGELDGIVSQTTEQTLKNVGTLSVDGMIDTDRTILKILMEKKLT